MNLFFLCLYCLVKLNTEQGDTVLVENVSSMHLSQKSYTDPFIY